MSKDLPRKVNSAAVEITVKKGVRSSKTHSQVYVLRPTQVKDADLVQERDEFFAAHGIKVS